MKLPDTGRDKKGSFPKRFRKSIVLDFKLLVSKTVREKENNFLLPNLR